MVKLEFPHGDEVAEFLVQVLDPDFRHRLHSGNFETMTNITVPTSVVAKD